MRVNTTHPLKSFIEIITLYTDLESIQRLFYTGKNFIAIFNQFISYVWERIKDVSIGRDMCDVGNKRELGREAILLFFGCSLPR